LGDRELLLPVYEGFWDSHPEFAPKLRSLHTRLDSINHLIGLLDAAFNQIRNQQRQVTEMEIKLLTERRLALLALRSGVERQIDSGVLEEITGDSGAAGATFDSLTVTGIIEAEVGFLDPNDTRYRGFSRRGLRWR
jgi:hypothetical protein